MPATPIYKKGDIVDCEWLNIHDLTIVNHWICGIGFMYEFKEYNGNIGEGLLKLKWPVGQLEMFQ